jgi:hypothetical protein
MISTLQQAVRYTIEQSVMNGSQMNEVIAFLKEKPEEVINFCAEIQDAYPVHDRRTPVVLLGYVLLHVLKRVR